MREPGPWGEEESRLDGQLDQGHSWRVQNSGNTPGIPFLEEAIAAPSIRMSMAFFQSRSKGTEEGLTVHLA